MARLRKTMDCGCKVSVDYNDMIKIDYCKIHSEAEKVVEFWQKSFGNFRRDLRNILSKNGVYKNLGESDSGVLQGVQETIDLNVQQERIKWCKALMKIGILVAKPEDLGNLQRIGKVEKDA